MITSKQNQMVKTVVSLKQKKNRDSLGLYVVEGEKMVFDAITFGANITQIFATEKYINYPFENSEKVVFVSDAVFKIMSDEVTPQGILAVVKIPKSGDITQLSRCLLLDRVQDPGNVGAIIRLAVACGVSDILTIDSADAYSQKAVRSSMSGIYHVNIFKYSESECINIIKQNALSLICADLTGQNIFEYKTPEKFCLCVGNEGNGISDNLIKSATDVISIPMHKGVESLNVAVATGVTLYTLLNNL